MPKVKVAVLTVSDRVAAGEYEDKSGPLAVEILRDYLGVSAGDVTTETLPDERAMIEAVLRRWCDEEQYNLVITNGGTGLAPRDVTPNATLAVLDYEIPGLGEVMRAASLLKTPMAALSRATAGLRGKTLIVNLPGSPNGVQDCLMAVMTVLPHALEQVAGVGEHEGHDNLK